MKAQVLLPKVFNFPFTYNSKNENKIGNLVEIPFGSKNEIGVIWKNNFLEPKNIKIKDNDILKKPSIKNAIKIANKMIKGQGRILVRKSGTEPKIRIMGECKDKILLNKCIKIIIKTIN